MKNNVIYSILGIIVGVFVGYNVSNNLSIPTDIGPKSHDKIDQTISMLDRMNKKIDALTGQPITSDYSMPQVKINDEYNHLLSKVSQLLDEREYKIVGDINSSLDELNQNVKKTLVKVSNTDSASFVKTSDKFGVDKYGGCVMATSEQDGILSELLLDLDNFDVENGADVEEYIQTSRFGELTEPQQRKVLNRMTQIKLVSRLAQEPHQH